MEGEEEGGGGEGAGGKLTRRSLARRPPGATPYDRPLPSEGGASSRQRWCREGDGEGGWFSRTKLLPRRASRLFPSVFPSFAAPASPPSHSEDPARLGSSGTPLEIEQDSDITKHVFNSQGSHLIETRSSASEDHPKCYCNTDECAKGRVGNTHDDIGFADLEQRLKQKTFSRDESNRLIELLRSRTTDLSEDNKRGVGFLAHDSGNAWDQKHVSKSIEEKKPVQLNLRVHNETVFDEVGTSPVEIAKAFMESRSLALRQDSHGGFLRADKTPLCDRGSAASSSVTSIAQTPGICSLGAVVQADHCCFTPQTQKGRAGLHSLPRTTCPGESFQRSITKFQCSSERHPNLPFTPWKQSPTPVFGADKKRSSTPGDDQTAVLPILGLEQKNMTMSFSKGATPYNSASFRSALSARSDVFRGSTSTKQRNLKSGTSRCTIIKHKATCTENDSLETATGLLRVHPKSSEVARKIFEHLDRTALLPQDKLLEPKFLIEKRTFPQSGVTKMLDGWDNKPSPGSPSTSVLLGTDVLRNAGVPKNLVFPYDGNITDERDISCDHLRPKNEGILNFDASVNDPAVPQTQKFQPPCQYLGCGRVLTTTTKKASSFPDSGLGLPFPVAVASNASHEHVPTPIVAQSSSASKEETSSSFSFGSSAIGSRQNFSFGPVHNFASITISDSSIPQYRFGSDDSSRLSFRPFVKEAVSC